MMKKMVLYCLALGLLFFETGWAKGFEAELSVGNTSIDGGVHFKNEIAGGGFWKAGSSVIYTDDDETEYKWAELDFRVGSDTWQPGLTTEVGLKTIFGDAEDNGYSGDVGALAFSGRIGYVFPTTMLPLPLEVFGSLSYAPEILSFRDTDDYMAYEIGAGVRIVQNASIILKYVAYDMDMETGTRGWNFDDDALRIGLVMRF